MTRRIAESIADAIEQRAPQVPQQRPLTLRLEGAEIPDRLEHGFLHDIGGIHGIPCPSWDAAVCPAVQGGKVALEESIKCPIITSARAPEQFERGRIGHRRSRHRWPNHTAPPAGILSRRPARRQGSTSSTWLRMHSGMRVHIHKAVREDWPRRSPIETVG